MDFSLSPFFFFFICISLAIPLFYVLRSARAQESCKGKLPPGPIPLPILGNLLKLGNMPHQSLARLAKTYGPIMTLKLGYQTTIVVSSPAMAREVLQKHDQAFSGRAVPDAIYALRHGELAVTWLPPSQPWRNLRKIYNTHLVSTQRLNSTRDLRSQKVRELVEFVRQHSAIGQPLDVGRALLVTLLNYFSNTIFSADVADLNSGTAQAFRDLAWNIMEEIGSPNISDFFPLLRLVDPQGRRRRLTFHLKKLHEIFDETIKRRQSLPREARPNDILDELLDNGPQLELLAIKALFAEIFLAGSDTSSSTVEWAMAELLRAPEAMARIRAELNFANIGPGEEIDETNMSRFPYLQAVVKETFRLHPPAPFLIPHRAETSVDMCGYTVPKHTRVLVNVWTIGRDPDVWTDPNSFMPERFLGRDLDFRGRDFELIPFGAGRRICPGLLLANRLVHLLLVSLLRFDWKLPDGMGPSDVDMAEKFGITLGMAVPLRAVPCFNVS